MTEIYYKIIGGYGECIDFVRGDARAVKITVENTEGGIIQIGSRTKRLSGGVCYLSLSELLDGDYSPTLSQDGRNIPLAGIRKMGEKLTRPPIETALASRLLLRAEAAEKRLDELDGRLRALEDDVRGTPIFTT